MRALMQGAINTIKSFVYGFMGLFVYGFIPSSRDKLG